MTSKSYQTCVATMRGGPELPSMISVSMFASLKTEAVTSTGLEIEPNDGIAVRSRLLVASLKAESVKPRAMARSVNRIPAPPEMPIDATRGPAGSNWLRKARQASAKSAISKISIMPDCRNAAR